jgi:DnaB-like helicase C terminal domain
MYKVVTSSKKGTRKLQPYNPKSFYSDGVKEVDTAMYESLYLYKDEHKKQLDERGTLSGITGLVTNKVVFDFDSKENPSDALLDAKNLVKDLKKILPDNAIRCYFSGGKGYHVEIHFSDGEFITRPEFESIVASYGNGYKTFDRVVKDDQRIFRMAFSKHEETGLYKIPVETQSFIDKDLSHNDIMALARKENLPQLRKVYDNYISVPIPDRFKLVTAAPYSGNDETRAERDYSERPDVSRRPKGLTEAKYALLQGYFDQGERNEACMILAATFKNLGFDAEHTYNMLKATLRKRAERLGLDGYDKEELYREIITPVFSPMWKGGMFTEKDGLLKTTIERYGLQKSSDSSVGLCGIDDLADIYGEFARNIDKNTIKLGIPELDAKLTITTSMFVCLLAPPSAGKTSIAFNVLNTLSDINEKAIFFSMDMAVPQIYQRLIQRHAGKKESELKSIYKEDKRSDIEKFKEVLSTSYKNVRLCFKSGLTTEMIREIIIHEQDMTGVKPKLVVIDYLECIHGPFSDPTANKALIATQLKDIANELGICVFLLVQPAKVTGDPSHELNSYTQIKGSSVLGEAATVVLAMHRPGFSPKVPEMDKFLTINVVKNRMGELSSTDLGWDGLTGRTYTLDVDQIEELKQIRAAKEAAEKGQGTYESAASRIFGNKHEGKWNNG